MLHTVRSYLRACRRAVEDYRDLLGDPDFFLALVYMGLILFNELSGDRSLFTLGINCAFAGVAALRLRRALDATEGQRRVRRWRRRRDGKQK